MMPTPAAIDSTWLHCLSSAPKKEAVAPNATNTVEKPATNSTAAITVSRRASASPSTARASNEVPAR